MDGTMIETALPAEIESTPDAALDGRLQLVRRVASPRLRGVARDFWGYSERTGYPLRRRELPSADIIFIVNLGEPLRVEQPRSEARVVPSGSGFVAGLHETYTVTETAGSQAGVELRLSPLAAYRLIGQPLQTLVNRSVGLDELFGRWATGLSEQMQNAPDWESRFAALDAALEMRLSETRAPTPEMVWVWRQLVSSGGQVSIAMLADELGWSPKRLIARCREQIGLPPKQVARLLRFQRAASWLTTETPDWGAIARHCGYYDQAHLINEFQRFAGDTPQGLARRRLATGGGFAAD
jgi:AraC-like DNA-binding protein